MTKIPLAGQTLIELTNGQTSSKVHPNTNFHNFISKFNIFPMSDQGQTEFESNLARIKPFDWNKLIYLCVHTCVSMM